MPYQTINELPEPLRNVLLDHAQVIFKEAFNNAYDEYKDPKDRREDISREDTSRRVAWAAVKRTYEKGDDGLWHLKKR